MKTSPIFFERHVDFSNKQLIKASELRRKIAQGVQHNENMYSKAEEYYKLLSKIAVPTTSLKNPLLFVWCGKSSSCWNFEKLHILTLMAKWAHDNGVSKEPKEAKRWFSTAVKHEMQSMLVLNNYMWSDSDISILPILQHRYHLAKALLYASDYYYNMYTFKEVLSPIRMSYQLMEIASRTWKKLEYSQLNRRHALALKHKAESLTDDECGQKVALLEQALGLDNSEDIKTAFDKYKDDNDSVYYKTVTTELTISCLSLEDSFQSLLNIAS